VSNRDIYKDEFGQYHEVEEEVNDSVDGQEDDELDHAEDEDDLFDSAVDEDDSYDEDEDYANERRPEYDADED
jgi:hypothetical protein